MNKSTSREPSSKHRMRLHRLRRSRGLRCLTLEIRDAEVQALKAKNIIPEEPSEADIKNALYSILDRHFRMG